MQLTFAHTFARVAALTYGGGIIAHTLNLLGVLPVEQMPTWLHGVILLLASYSAAGFFYYRHQVRFKNGWEKLLYGLIFIHLSLSALLHLYSILASSNAWITVFPSWYSYLAIGYFAAFGYYCFSLEPSRAV